MKRIIAAMSALVLSVGCYAQDMIVKKDGTVIQAKVSEIGTSEVKYKKWSNQDGPSYAIAKSDIIAITYQNGEKETFETTNETGSSNNSSNELSEKAKASNLKAIENWNNSSLVYTGKEGKSASYTFWAWGINSESLICNDDVEISFKPCYQIHYHEFVSKSDPGIHRFEWAEQNEKNIN